jgi:hypothetical protein
MILGYVKCRQRWKALKLFQQMQQGVQPNSVTFVGCSCASTIALHEGKFVHEQIIESGWNSNVLAGSSLIDMHVKCASMEDAQRVFKRMPS